MKSVCRTQRSGFVPRTTKAPGSAGSCSTVNPESSTARGRTVTRDPDDPEGFVVRGVKPERWVRQTDFTNDEAVGYLADRLNRLGVEEELLKQGAVAGDAVMIGDGPNAIVFDFAPEVQAGAEILARRGEDHRLEEARPAVQRRRAKDTEYHAHKGDRSDYKQGWVEDEVDLSPAEAKRAAEKAEKRARREARELEAEDTDQDI